MNSILMITAVAGTIVGNATFADMESCMKARADVATQDSVTVSCVYTTQRKDRSKEMLSIFVGAMQSMIAAAEKQKTEESP